MLWDPWGQRGGRRWPGDEAGGLVRRKLPHGHISNHCLCLSLPAACAGRGALQLCAPAFFLQGLLPTVLELSFLRFSFPVLLCKQVPENGEPGPQHTEERHQLGAQGSPAGKIEHGN